MVRMPRWHGNTRRRCWKGNHPRLRLLRQNNSSSKQQQQQPYLSVVQIFTDKHAKHLGQILQLTVTRPFKKKQKYRCAEQNATIFFFLTSVLILPSSSMSYILNSAAGSVTAMAREGADERERRRHL